MLGGAHLVLTTARGTEFIRLGRVPAHVAGNVEDNLLEGSAGVIRRGPESADLVLIDAQQACSDELAFRLEPGTGYVTIYDDGRAEGWSGGPAARVTVLLGEGASQSPSLTVDGSPASLEMSGRRAMFDLPSGAHRFRIE